MPLQGEVYVVENNPSTYIICLERHEGSNDHPGVGFRETELKNLIARMESEGGHCQEHGIFRTFSLLFFTTFYVVLPPHVLFSQFHSSKKRQDACY